MHEASSENMSFSSKNFAYVTKKFGDFLDEAEKGSKLYLRSLSAEKASELPANIVKDYPAISADFKLPSELASVKDNAHSSPLRISGPVNMWLHYDVSFLSTSLQDETQVSLSLGYGQRSLPSQGLQTPSTLPTLRCQIFRLRPWCFKFRYQCFRRSQRSKPLTYAPTRSRTSTGRRTIPPFALATYRLAYIWHERRCQRLFPQSPEWLCGRQRRLW